MLFVPGTIMGGYRPTNSGLWVAAETDRMTRTLGSITNRKKFTFATWVKRTSTGGPQVLLSADDGASRDCLSFAGATNSSGDKLSYRDSAVGSVEVLTTATVTSTTAWQHVMWAFDTDQATAADRVKVYLNGTQLTAMDVGTYPGLSSSTGFGTATQHFIGRRTSGIWHLDARLAETYLIWGQQLTPASFLDGTNPKPFSGSYGSADIYLKYANSGNLGTDSSGGGNDWTNTGVAQDSSVPP